MVEPLVWVHSDCFLYCQNYNCTAVLKFVKCRVIQVWSTDAYDNDNLTLHVVRPNYLFGSIYRRGEDEVKHPVIEVVAI